VFSFGVDAGYKEQENRIMTWMDHLFYSIKLSEWLPIYWDEG
jgi:hypothetical protein